MNTAVQKSSNYVWNGWYNDGMGLNGGNWTCAIDQNPNPLDNIRLPRHYFKTGWGENINLNIRMINHSTFQLHKSTAN